MRIKIQLLFILFIILLFPVLGSANKSIDKIYTFSDTTYTIVALGNLSFCQGSNVKLAVRSNMGFPVGINFQWKNPSNIPGATDSTYTTGITGSYNVVISRGVGRDTTLSNISVTVLSNPTADFSFSQSTTCAGVPVFYKDNSIGSISTYKWDFGDSQISNLSNPTHIFSSSYGNNNVSFTTTLTVTNTNGCTSLISKNVTVSQRPQANILGTSVTCTGANQSTFTFNNGSTTIATNTNYLFNWGDGSANTDITTFNTAQTHQYLKGNNSLMHIVTGNNSCKDTVSRIIYLGSNPSAGIASPGNTNICTNAALTFPISSFENNSPGTNYVISFNDGSNPLTFTQSTIPNSVSHTYTSGSCGTTSNGISNSFFAKIEATNPCATTLGTVTPIYVSEKPVANFSISKDTNCVNLQTTFSNTSLGYKTISTAGVCLSGNKVWQITPATGFTLASGQTMGNTFNDSDPLNWLNSSTDNLKVTFTTPGTYTIRLTIGGSSTCPPSFIEKTVCINAVPVASFTLDKNSGCLPLTINTNNIITNPNCGSNTYLWSTSYTSTDGCLPNTSLVAYSNGTNASSINPQYLFGNPGIYNVNLIAISPASACSSSVYTLPVLIKSKPTVSPIAASSNICVNNFITPISSIGNCNSNTAETYLWTFTGGSINSSSNASPGNITYSSAGSSTISLDVTNECGTTTVTKSLIVSPLPNAPIGNDNSRCGSGIITLNATAGVGETIDWYSSATGGTQLKPASLSYNTPSISTTTIYYAEARNIISGCISQTRTPVTAIINAIPTSPVIGSNSSICAGSTLNLSSTLIPSVTYLWSGPNGFTSSSQNPTITNATVAYSGTYTLVVSSNTCSTATVSTSVSVKPIPSSPTVSSNSPVCEGGILNLNASNISGATYVWSGPNGFSASSQNPTLTNVNLNNDGIFSVTATVNGCGNASSNTTVKINSLPSLTITNPATVCSLVPVDLTKASITNGSSSGLNYSYWNNIQATSIISNPNSVLTAGTYFIKGTNSNSCTIVKSVVVSFNPLPKNFSVIGGGSYCSGGTGLPIGLSGSESGVNYQLMIDNNPVGSLISGTGSSISFGNQTSAGLYTVIGTNTTTNCTKIMNSSVSISINSLATPSINITSSASTICVGTSVTFTATANNAGSLPIYQWQLNGINVGLNSATYNSTNLANNDIITCILTTSGCSTDANVSSNALTMIVKAVPTINSVTPGSVCGSGVVSLTASSNAGIINWYTNSTGGVSLGSGNLFNTPSLNSTTNYYVEATNNSCVTNSRTLVLAIVNPLPQATVISTKTICNGSDVQIGATAISGNTYLWTSVPSSNISNISNPTVSPIENTTYTLQEIVNSSGCSKSNSVTINVNPLPNVTANPVTETICSNSFTNIALATTIPSTIYNWTVSNNSNISGGLAGTGNNISQKLINTSSLPQTITYKIIPSYIGNNVTCNGLANNVVITVNPSPGAQFSRSNETICSNSATSLVTLNSTTTDAQLSWTATQPSGISGVITSGTINIPVQTLVNSTSLPITVSYNAIAKTNDINSCFGVNATYNITVNPIPNIIATPSVQTICSNSKTGIVLSTTLSGTSFDWLISSNSNIVGASTGSGNSINQTLINTSATVQIIQYTITPKILNNGILCYGTPIIVPITINPSPSLDRPLTQAPICSNNLFNYIPTSNTPNTIFSWTRNAVNGISNPAISNGINGINEILINTTQTPLKVTYNYTLSANGCSNNQEIFVTVYPNAKSIFVADKLISCAPYKLIDHINVSRFPLANDEVQYIWLANSIQIATGLQVPSYVITNPSDTVKLSLIAKSIYGCTSDTMTQTLYTIEKIVPGFSLSSHKSCGPISISIKNTTNPINALNNSTYFWDFGNGNSSNNINPPTQIYNSSPNLKDTIYYVTLTVTTQCETLRYIDSILIRPPAKALFTPNSTVGCSPFNVTFRNNSLGANTLGNAMVYYWDFGDGSYDTTFNLNSTNHIYHNGSQKTDTVIAKLIAKNECGVDSIQYNIIVFPNTVKPALIINGNERYACAPHTVHFYNNSTGATRFNWNFGDGTTFSSTKSSDTVIHVYNTAGNFIVTLNATNGCSDTTISDSVIVYPSIDLPKFSIIKPISCLIDSVQFKNNTDTTNLNSFIWDFGDGSTSNSFQISHQYKQSGSFNVNLLASKTYTTGVSCSNSVTKTVQILNNPNANFTSNNNILNCSPFNYSVNASSSIAGSAEWIFRDPYSTDTTAIGFSAKHVFSKAGTYFVQLKVTNQNGCSDSTIQTVIVTESPIAKFSYTDSIICTKNGSSKLITFTNTTSFSGQNIIKYEWLVDGILSGTSPNSFTHLFVANPTDVLPKIFNVSLKAISSFGCTSTKINPVSFVPYPKASISVSKLSSCGNSNITAKDNEILVPHSRKWTCTTITPNAPLLVINNDTSAVITISIPSNKSTAIIDYKLILTVNSLYGCADSIVQQIRIYPNPKVEFLIKDSICSNINYLASNVSDPLIGGDINSMSFGWFIKKFNGNGDTILTNYYNDINPAINLLNSGIKDSTYFINLIGTTSNGCIDSIVHKVILHPLTIAAFTAEPVFSCTPLNLSVLSNLSKNVGAYSWYINNVLFDNLKIPADTVLTKSGINYNLKLVVTNPYGCLSDSITSVITTYKAPVPTFTLSQESSCSGSLQVSFYNNSIAFGTKISLWNWDFGDGTKSTVQNPIHQYSLPGTYKVRMNVQDDRGCFSDSTAEKNIVIYGKPTASFFTNNVCLGDSIQLTNRSLLGYGSTQFDKTFWSFGDGTNSTQFSPSHFYSSPGTYIITLIVLSDKSCVADTMISKVIIYGKPIANFSWDSYCVNNPINFTNLSVAGLGETALSNTKWDFGNGVISNQFSPRIQYSNIGSFQISLKVNNAICTKLADTMYKTINIYEARKGVRYPRVEAVYGTPKQLYAFDGGVTYNWTPTTGLNSSNIKDPIAVYDNRVSNKIDYSITIKDSAGCIINDFQEIFIFLKAAIYAPSAFVVDGTDPLNRRFLPHYININRLVNFRIIDRWGIEHFSTSDMSKYWDGNDRKGNPLPLETYIWIAEGVDNKGIHVIGKGNITLIRNGTK